jgi:hypothetical protein
MSLIESEVFQGRERNCTAEANPEQPTPKTVRFSSQSDQWLSKLLDDNAKKIGNMLRKSTMLRNEEKSRQLRPRRGSQVIPGQNKNAPTPPRKNFWPKGRLLQVHIVKAGEEQGGAGRVQEKITVVVIVNGSSSSAHNTSTAAGGRRGDPLPSKEEAKESESISEGAGNRTQSQLPSAIPRRHRVGGIIANLATS